jgi:hypothetical protein
MAIINFNANEVAPDAGRGDPVPLGWYIFVAKELKLEPTQDTLGTKITGIMEIVDGQYKGRKVYHNFNMTNPSEKAQKIGRGQFSALCHATGILLVDDTDKLLNIPFKGRIKVTPAEGQYEAKNEFTAFKNLKEDVGGVAGAVATMAAPVAAVAPPPPGATPVVPGAAPAGWTQPAAVQPWGAQAAPVDPNVAVVPITTAVPSPEVVVAPVEAAVPDAVAVVAAMAPPWEAAPQ